MKVKNLCKCCLVVIIGLFSYTASWAEEVPWTKKLPFENATINYTISGLEQGEEILYIRDYGKEQATYSDSITKIMGMAVEEKRVEFVDEDYVYSYDLQAKEGTKSVNPQKYMAKAYAKLTREEKKQVLKNAEEMGTAFTSGMGGSIQEKATEILGYECDKIDIMGGGATYVMHGTGIPLKVEVNMMGMKLVTMATSVDTGKIDPRHFVHPVGIEAKVDPEADAVAEAMGQQVIDSLKDPEAAEKGMSALHGAAAQENMTEEEKQIMEEAGELLKGMQNIFGQ
ncbi:hypothetical protein [Desulforhopalus sp. 52FAK]